MAVLKKYPAAVCDGTGAESPSVDLLSLTHTNRFQIDASLLGELLDTVARIGAHREEADQWFSRIALLEHSVEVEYDALVESLSDRVADELLGLEECAIWAPGADEKQFTEDV